MAHPDTTNIDQTARELITQARSAHSGRAAVMVRGGPETHMTQTVIALKAGASMSEHQNPGEATILVLQGQVRLTADDQTWHGGRGDVINVPSARHSLQADTESAILLTAVKLAAPRAIPAAGAERSDAGPAGDVGSHPSSEVEDVSTKDCWTLLRTGTLARLAVWVDDHPDIFPINYVVDHGSIVFRTGEGTKLHGALTEKAVAVEVDGYSPESSQAWSVVLKGHAQAIRRTDELLDTVGLPLFPSQGGDKNRFVRILPDDLTGRRFVVVDPDRWRLPGHDARRTPLE